MANEKHLKILKQGVEAWNQWRRKTPDVRTNLSGGGRDNLNGALARHLSYVYNM